MTNKPTESIIHVKVPRELHMTVKIRAMEEGMSMNEYVAVQLESATKHVNKSPKYIEMVEKPIKAATEKLREAQAPKQRDVVREYTKPISPTSPMAAQKVMENGACKIHGTPLDWRGKCTQKGCKYA